MSDVALGTSTFIVPPGLVLPPGSQPDFAREETIPVGDFKQAGERVYLASGQNYDIVSLITTTLQTSSDVGNRVAFVLITDEDGNVLFYIPAALPQAAAITGHYTWSTSASAAWGNAAADSMLYQVSPLPTVLLYPAYGVTIGSAGASTTDDWGGTTLTTTHIPTAPITDQSESDLVATPLVL